MEVILDVNLLVQLYARLGVVVFARQLESYQLTVIYISATLCNVLFFCTVGTAVTFYHIGNFWILPKKLLFDSMKQP